MKLRIDELDVASFPTGEGDAGEGTVRAMMAEAPAEPGDPPPYIIDAEGRVLVHLPWSEYTVETE